MATMSEILSRFKRDIKNSFQAQKNIVDVTEKYIGLLENAEGGSGSGGIDYSTTEQDTGLKWIDGKPVYQITLTGTGTQAINITALNIDTFCGVDSGATYVIRHDTQQVIFLDSTNPNGANYGWIMVSNSTKTEIEIITKSYSIDDYVFTIRYTKK